MCYDGDSFAKLLQSGGVQSGTGRSHGGHVREALSMHPRQLTRPSGYGAAAYPSQSGDPVTCWQAHDHEL